LSGRRNIYEKPPRNQGSLESETFATLQVAVIPCGIQKNLMSKTI